MAGVLAATQQLVDQLAAEGLRTTLDPRNAHPPCVYVEADTLEPHSHCASTATWRLWLISPGGANADALATIDPMLTTAMAALSGYPSGRLVSWASPTTGDSLLAWELSYTARIDWT